MQSRRPMLMRELRTGGQPSSLIALWFLPVCAFLLLEGMTTAQALGTEAAPCDPNLISPSGEATSYHLRGDRCEGVYVKQVAGESGLLVASFTEAFEDFDSSSKIDLHLEWKPLGTGNVHVRAYSLKRRLYYRMDSVRPVGKGKYDWPSDILSALSVTRNDVGVVCWEAYSVGKESRNVYLPLRITQKGRSGHGDYQLLIVPSMDLDEVFINLATVKQDGTPLIFLRRDEKLGYGYYPSERAISIPIKSPKNPGMYFVEIGAKVTGGGVSSIRLWFYHAAD
jgi:hypothetical protein